MADELGRACSRSRAWYRAQWLEHVLAWEESGVSGVAYCERHGLRPRSLYRWRRVFRGSGELSASPDSGPPLATHGSGEPSSPMFAQVHVSDLSMPGLGASGIEMVLCGGRRVRVAPGFDEATARRVVALLESLPVESPHVESPPC